MNFKLLTGSLYAMTIFLANSALACLPPPHEAPIPREAGEGDTDYQARMTRLLVESQASRQAEAAAFAITRENNLWDYGIVKRIAVVDVIDIVNPSDTPPSMTTDFLFSTVMPERGMARNERFTLTENRFWQRPCVPVVIYPVGARYILFTSDGPVSRSLPMFVLIPAAEVRSKRGLALLLEAERAAR